MNRLLAARALARAMLDAPWNREGLLTAGQWALAADRPPTWLSGVVRRVLHRFPDPPLGHADALGRFVAGLPAFLRATTSPRRVSPRRACLGPHRMGPSRFEVPTIATVGELARWLSVDPTDLDWLTDRSDLVGRLAHYHVRWVVKPDGRIRALEAPKPRLKELQRKILREILDRVPPHPSAMGFRKGRSILDFVGPHVGKAVVARFDLEEFFGSVRGARVRRIFDALGYPEHVAAALAALCTSRVPTTLPGPTGHWLTRQRLASPHLPQGAPTSPALANLAAWGLDVRLSALADRCGLAYTRYADDLAFSGDQVGVGDLVPLIAAEEGFRVRPDKTRIMGRGGRQELGGIVVNARPNVRRADVERLEATLFNCVRYGPTGQDREGHADFRAHLLGRVSWVAAVNPAKGARLRALFDAIDWSAVG